MNRIVHNLLSSLAFVFLSLFFHCTEFPSQPEQIIKEVVIIETEPNTPPVAIIEIAEARTEFVPGDTVRLNGSKSYDPDSLRDPQQKLRFSWHALNGGRLSDTASPGPYFISDSSGKFDVSLTVSDSFSYSLPAIIRLVYAQIAQTPIAVIKVSPSDTTLVGKQVSLDGSQSHDPNNDTLTYHWQSHDGGTITDTSAQITEFSASEAGTYVISLRVSDGEHTSGRAFHNIVVVDTLAPPNMPPVLSVTQSDTLVDPETTVVLDASLSNDPEGGRLRFHWQKLNGGELQNETGSMTQFRAKEPNVYVISVEVFDSLNASVRGFVNIRVKGEPPDTSRPNLQPIADAGQDHFTFIGAPVLLDGSGSIDLNGDILSYQWQVIDAGTLATPLAKTTMFTPAAKGIFRFSLTVSDGSLRSVPDTVRVIVQNRPPTAVALKDTTINTEQTAILDASQSFDPDGDKLTYQWNSLDGGAIGNANARTTTFSAKAPGDYDVSLIVNDGEADSKRDFVRIRVQDSNRPPTAIAGNDTTILLGGLAVLDGSQSFDPDGDHLTYTWTALNGGAIRAPTQKSTTFETIEPGDYVISLVVHDGRVFSDPDYKQVTVTDTIPTGKPPRAHAGRDTTYLLGEAVTLDGSKSRDPDGKQLNYHWIGAETNPDKVALSDTSNPTFTPRFPGEYIFILYVDNGEQFSKPDQVKIEIAAPDIIVKTGDSINAAIRMALPGYLIFIEPGTYAENVTIANKDSLTLLSTDVAGTIIDGMGKASTFRLIDASGVTIRGFTIKKGGTSDPPYDIDVAGITCQNSTAIRIKGNRIENNFGDGVRLYFSQAIIIEQNEIVENDVNGIRSTVSSFEVLENRIAGNGWNRSTSAASITVQSRADTVVDVSSLAVQIRSNIFENNIDNHIQLANNQIVFIDDNTFLGIGAIETNENSGVDLTITNNSFRSTTTSSIFCRPSAKLNIQNNKLVFTGASNLDKKGIDLINCTGIVAADTIVGFQIGLITTTTSGQLTIEDNLFMQNSTGIKVVGMAGNCPTVRNNQFSGNGAKCDFNPAETNCSRPPECQ